MAVQYASYEVKTSGKLLMFVMVFTLAQSHDWKCNAYPQFPYELVITIDNVNYFDNSEPIEIPSLKTTPKKKVCK